MVGELDPENPATVDKEDLLKWVEDDIVYYHGFIKDVRPLIQQSDCVVLPSYREGLPRIIIEGLSMTKPVITTLTAGCEETVEEGKNGYLVPVKDVHALVQAMERFLTLTEDQKIQMGNYGRIKAESEFDSILIAEQYLRLIQSKTT
ncbi:MAG: glycosyltransferase [Saprospiraceae bacterium]|nr:glycosyltransferase [Saprospiraceae bacterium]